MAHLPEIIARHRPIDGFLLSARKQGYVFVQDALIDVGERREAWADIESGRDPLADLDALVELLRERDPDSPPGVSEWAIAMAAAPLHVQEIERWLT